jgi:Fic/DOC family
MWRALREINDGHAKHVAPDVVAAEWHRLSLTGPGRKLALRLRHPLSLRALALSPDVVSEADLAKSLVRLAERTTNERQTLLKCESDICKAIHLPSGNDFALALEHAASELHGYEVYMRKGNVTIKPDHTGVGWRCIKAEEINEHLSQLQQYLKASAEQPPLISAIVSLVMLSSIHPFIDGNGRLSRILFHAVLRQQGLDDSCYLPLKWFYGISACGYEIRLRQTLLSSDWSEIIRYFCNVIECWSLLMPELARTRANQ